MQLSIRALVALILASTVSVMMASPAAIGFAAANGSFQVNSKETRGTATLFDGNVIETGKAPSQLSFSNGVQLRLATDSRAKVYTDRIVLEKGSGQIESSSSFPIEGRTLRVISTEPDTVARVLLADQGKVMVSTIRGAVRVTNSAGLAVANVTTGLSMAFEPQAGLAAPAKLAGCLYQYAGKDYIFDAATKVAHGLSGSGLAKLAGRNVELTGTEDPATHLINVATWKPLPNGECAKFAKVAKESGVETAAKTVGIAGGAAAAAAAGAAAAGAAAGVGVATTVAVVGGVAAATTVGGLAASGSFSGSSSPSPTSR